MSLSCFVQDMEWRGIFRHFVSKYALRHSICPFIIANHGTWEPSEYFGSALQKVSERLQSCSLSAFLPLISVGGCA